VPFEKVNRIHDQLDENQTTTIRQQQQQQLLDYQMVDRNWTPDDISLVSCIITFE
jgi:hypothetical protein